MPRRILPLCVLLLAALGPVAPARAALFPGETIDGPGADIRAFGDLDVARDGTGELVYVKADGGEDHVFAARLRAGAWEAVQRVDAGLAGASSRPVVAVADRGRAAIAFLNGGSLYGATRGIGAEGWSAPVQLDAGPGATNPAIDMSINGVAYVVYAAPGAATAVRAAPDGGFAPPGTATDVRAARMQDGTWSPITTPLDVDPGRDAGGNLGRPRVAVSADNNAVAVWGEDGRVVARRLTVLTPSLAPQDLTLPDVEGRAGAGADSPDLDIEDDGSFAWVVFRQLVNDGGAMRGRTIARRLVGSAFEAPVVIDGGDASELPRIDMTGRGDGLAVAGGAPSRITTAAVLSLDAFAPGGRVDASGSAAAPLPVPALGENGVGLVAWERAPGGAAAAEVRVRTYRTPTPLTAAAQVGTFDAEQSASDPAFGSTDAPAGLAAAADRAGDAAIAFAQGKGAERRIVAAAFDRPPSLPVALTTTKWRQSARPTLTWRRSTELWGAPTYEVEIDGQGFGTTTETRLQLADKLPDGIHRWRVIARDRRGQPTPGRSRLLRVDALAPTVELRISGRRVRGQPLRFRLRADDGDATVGAGLKRTAIDYGDPTPPVPGSFGVHRYAHAGRYRIRAIAVDRAGNVRVLERTLRIAAPKRAKKPRKAKRRSARR